MKADTAFVLGDKGPSCYYRLVLPGLALKTAGEPVDFAYDYEDFEAADVLVFQRQFRPQAISEVMQWKKRGKKIIIDFDDNFFDIHEDNRAKNVYTPAVLERLAELMGAADALTVATEPLAELYSSYNEKIFVMPNSLPEQAFAIKRRPSAEKIVGWHGGESHFDDLRMVRSALTSMSKKYGFELVLAGYNPPGVFKKVRFRPWIPFSPDLAHFQLFSDFAIGLCPVTRTPFNDCKSDLKWLEYSALGIPSITSASPAYREVEEGVTGLVARNLAEWEKQLKKLLTEPEFAAEMGQRARDHVHGKRTIAANLWRWHEVLEAI